MKKIAVKNFFYPPVFEPEYDTNLYEADLGFDQYDHDMAMAVRTENVLWFMLDVIGFDVYFFYTATMRWYLIDHCNGIRLLGLRTREDWDGKYIRGNSIVFSDDVDSPDTIFRADTVDEFIKRVRIDGKPIGEVLDWSFIDEYS
ncbi:MAG: hypothetical protein LUI04_06010 [Porphyromonadaceae bacterium]|nr:hypothetical protein [Porphyromonadaceae bacterium]